MDPGTQQTKWVKETLPVEPETSITIPAASKPRPTIRSRNDATTIFQFSRTFG